MPCDLHLDNVVDPAVDTVSQLISGRGQRARPRNSSTTARLPPGTLDAALSAITSRSLGDPWGSFGLLSGGLVIWHVATVARRQRTHPKHSGNPINSEQDEGCRVANIKSQIKRNKQNEKRRLRNKSVKSALKTAVRKFHEASVTADLETATTLMRDASRKLDKAVSKGVIHKNQAANRKSAIAKKLASLSSAS